MIDAHEKPSAVRLNVTTALLLHTDTRINVWSFIRRAAGVAFPTHVPLHEDMCRDENYM